MTGIGCSVSRDADVVCLTVTIFVVHAVHGLTVDLQTAFGSLEQVVEAAVLVLVKASATGVTAVLCLTPVYNDGLLTAVVITVMKTICYIAIQFCHDDFPPDLIDYINLTELSCPGLQKIFVGIL